MLRQLGIRRPLGVVEVYREQAVQFRSNLRRSLVIQRSGAAKLRDNGLVSFRSPNLCHSRSFSSAKATVSSSLDGKNSKPESNVLLDNLGYIFLSAIGLIVVSLVRSYYGSQNRRALRDALEDASVLDPLEIDDLRTANSELSPSVFLKIIDETMSTFPHGKANYADFCKAVRRAMALEKGEEFTIQLGHLLDRAVLASLEKRGKLSSDEMPLAYWLTVLSLCLNSSTVDRIRILYTIMGLQPQTESPDTEEIWSPMEQKTDGDSSFTVASNFKDGEQAVTLDKVIDLVGYLQETCQLVPDSQIYPSGENYIPVQQYNIATAEELVFCSDYGQSITDAKKAWTMTTKQETVDMDAFATILRSKSVCAWGECYNRKKRG